MKFKERAFKMRACNQEILEAIAARLHHGYNEELLPDIIKLMNKWAVEFEKVKKLKDKME